MQPFDALSAHDNPPLLIQAAALWDGISAMPIDQGGVLVQEGRIVAVGPAAGLPRPDGMQTLQYETSTLMPGLIDCHSHLNFRGDGSSIETMMEDPDELLMTIGVENLRKTLQSGVTTLCDNGARGQTARHLRTALEKGYIAGPRLLISGRPITITRGHCWLLGGEADGEEAVRAAVDRLVEEGVDWIKIMASGGGTKGTVSHRPSYSRAEVQAIIDAAHAAGRWVGAHCNSIPGMYELMEAGVDMLIHANFNNLEGEYVYEPRLAATIAATGTWVNPTLHVCRGRIRRLEQRKAAGTWSGEEETLLQRQYAYWAQISETFERMLAEGVRFTAGSDAGWSYFAFGDFWLEIDAQVACGMSRLDALRSATSLCAQAIGVETETGTLEAGKSADLLVVDGDPLQDLSALSRVRAVFLGGRPVV